MDRLWGEIVPVPQENIRTFAGGESVDGWRVAATPGHASHHVAYLREDEGWAFVGDVAGVRIIPAVHHAAHAAAGHRSRGVAGVAGPRRGWNPSLLALTHFGTYDDVDAHIERLRGAIVQWGELARRSPMRTASAPRCAAAASSVANAGDAAFDGRRGASRTAVGGPRSVLAQEGRAEAAAG